MIDLFCCRKQNPALLEIIQDFPEVDAKSIVGPYLRKNLDPVQIEILRGRVERLAFQSDNRKDQSPQNRLIFDAYSDRLRLIDSLERERVFAIHSNRPDIAARFAAQMRGLQGDPIYPKALVSGAVPERDIYPEKGYDVTREGDVLRKNGGGRFKIALPDGSTFYESADFQVQQDLDFNQGSRVAQKTICDKLLRKEWAKDLYIGEYKRIPKPTNENAHRKWTVARERTANIDRKEALLTMGQLKEEIMQGHSDQMDWNTYLRVSDYIDSIKLHDLQRTEVGYLQNPEFARALAEFNQISIYLEDLIKNRVLINFLESRALKYDAGDAKRKMDLAAGVKQLAEIARVFEDWIGSIQTIVDVAHPDFRWFEREFRRILPEFQNFARSLPIELSLINALNPAEIRARFQPQELQSLIDQTLDCINGPFYQLFPTLLYQLQMAQSGKTLIDARTKVFKRHEQNRPFYQAVQLALPNAFQVPTRVEGCVTALAEAVSRPSNPKVLRTYQTVKQVAFETEKMRVEQSRLLLAGHSKESALRHFYPTV